MAGDDVIEEARRVLIEVARRGETITYDGLVERVGAPDDAVLRERMAEVLRTVSTTEDEAGRGLLTAIVVRRDGGLPGGGWFALAASRGRAVDDRERCWRDEVARVHRAWRDEQ